MQKTVLSEYEDACRLVEETERDLDKLRKQLKDAATDIVKGSNPNFPYEARTFHIEGVSYGEYMKPDEVKRLEFILTQRRNIAKERRLVVEYWMNTVPPRIARIVRLKYFKKLGWTEVAMQVGCGSGDAVRMELNRYLKDKS
jgi:hypothetical protein